MTRAKKERLTISGELFADVLLFPCWEVVPVVLALVELDKALIRSFEQSERQSVMKMEAAEAREEKNRTIRESRVTFIIRLQFGLYLLKKILPN